MLFFTDLKSSAIMNKIDLHSFFLEEAFDILEEFIIYLKKSVKNNSHRLQFVLKNNKRCILLEIVTGKGLHSEGKKPVLYNHILRFIKGADYLYKEDKTNTGRVFLFIPC